MVEAAAGKAALEAAGPAVAKPDAAAPAALSGSAGRLRSWKGLRAAQRVSGGLTASAKAAKACAAGSGSPRRRSMDREGRRASLGSGLAIVGKRSTMQPHASSVLMLNRSALSWLQQVMPRLLQAPLWLSILLGAALYAGVVLAFAAIFYGLGAGCFDGYYTAGAPGGAAPAGTPAAEAFTFVRTLWLSVHTFSTVGFGSVYPACDSAELFVLLESYVALLVTFWFSGFMLFAAMRPRSRVRFSKNFLLTTQEGELHLTLRMVRESPHALRDARVTVQALVLEADARGATVGRCEELRLEACTAPSLDHWLISHSVEPGSPLWDIRDALETRLSALEVSLCVFDTAYMQEVRLYASYAANEFVRNAHFTPMTRLVDAPPNLGFSLRASLGGRFSDPSARSHPPSLGAAGARAREPATAAAHPSPVLHIDHAKIDEYMLEGRRVLKRRPTFGGALGKGGRVIHRSLKNLCSSRSLLAAHRPDADADAEPAGRPRRLSDTSVPLGSMRESASEQCRASALRESEPDGVDGRAAAAVWGSRSGGLGRMAAGGPPVLPQPAH